jgi:hypothetical protein
MVMVCMSPATYRLRLPAEVTTHGDPAVPMTWMLIALELRNLRLSSPVAVRVDAPLIENMFDAVDSGAVASK